MTIRATMHSSSLTPLPGRLRPAVLGGAIALGLLLPLPVSAQNARPAAPLQTIERLDVARYMGTWYEIAKYPNVFQRSCATDTQAQYRQREDGQLDVVNRCRQANGELTEAVGRARQPGAADSPRLEVRFAPAWLSWLPMVWGNYWIIDLDPAYKLVAVSEPKREYLWVLSRSPVADPVAYQELLGRLGAQGFDVARLERTAQSGDQK